VKIVFVGPFGWQPKATMRTRALGLAQALVAQGDQVTILLPPWDDPARAGQQWQEGGVRIINVTLPPRWPLFFHILLTWKLVGQTLALKPEVVHLFKPKAYAGLAHLVLWWLRRLGGPALRLVVDEDDWEQAWNEVLPYSPGQKRFFAWQERWGLRHADAVTVASRTLEQLVLAERADNGAAVFYLPNGCQIADRQPPTADDQTAPSANPPFFQYLARYSSSTPIILLYTRFVEFKLARIVWLVQQVAAHCPAARWLVVGSGLNGEEKELAAQLAQAGLADYVHFTGWPVDNLAACFAAAQVAVFPYDDTLINRTKCSVKLIDLLQAGLPVVADDVGQNREYIQAGVSGWLTPPGDDVTLAQRLVTHLQTPELRQKMGQAARHHVEQYFSWTTLAQVAYPAYKID
jgi:glycosyltransferase involved in cell wall biosynthesis